MADTADPIDLHVGRRLRQRRTLLGMSQERLAELLGVTFQQVQKYERGANRIGASRLYLLGQALDVPVGWFFEAAPGPAPAPGLAEAERPAFDIAGRPGPAALGPAPLDGPVGQAADVVAGDRDLLDLARAYRRIAHPGLRRQLLALAKALAVFDAREEGASAADSTRPA